MRTRSWLMRSVDGRPGHRARGPKTGTGTGTGTGDRVPVPGLAQTRTHTGPGGSQSVKRTFTRTDTGTRPDGTRGPTPRYIIIVGV